MIRTPSRPRNILLQCVFYTILNHIFMIVCHGPLTRYVKLRVVHAPGIPGTFSPPPTSKEPVSYPGMHHVTCVTHVGWGISWSLTRCGGETFPAFPVHAQSVILRIRQEAHGIYEIACHGWRSAKALHGYVAYFFIKLTRSLHVIKNLDPVPPLWYSNISRKASAILICFPIPLKFENG